MNRKTIVLIILGVILSIFLFLEYKNYRRNQDNLFFLQATQNCMKICEPLYTNDKNFLGEEKAINPKYHYNQKNGLCYYSGGIDIIDYFEGELTRLTMRHVKECLTGKTLLYYPWEKNCNDFSERCFWDIESFIEEEKKIMSE